MKKIKLYNMVFPIWLLFTFPPLLLIIIPTNFVIDSFIIFISLKLLRISNIKDIYKKTIIKIWIIGFIADIIGSLILLLSYLLGTSPFVYANFTAPLSTNPFSNPYAIIYCTFAVLISGAFIYFLNRKISFVNTGLSERNKTILSLILALISAPYLFFMPTNLFVKDEYQLYLDKLEQYRDTSVNNKEHVNNIINIINNEKEATNFSVTIQKPNTIIIEYKDDDDSDMYVIMEEDAAIMFNLIKNLDVVLYKANGKDYNFYYKDLNKIYGNNIKRLSIEQIKSRYNEGIFSNHDMVYLGTINGLYNLVDESTLCSDELELIYEDATYKYSLSCSQIDFLYLIDNSNNKTLIKRALEDKIITIEELLKTNLYVHREIK